MKEVIDGVIFLRDIKDVIEETLAICRQLSSKWEEKLDELDRAIYHHSYGTPIESRLLVIQRGRPRFEISKEQLLYLSSLSFSWTDISKMLGVSRMTIYRRRVEFDLISEPENVPTDMQLLIVLREMKRSHPDMGEVMCMGIIRSMGYKVTRERLRQAIRSLDPLHTALRWRGGLLLRRPYSVAGPNSLWHIGMYMHVSDCIIYYYLDGHHKL